MATKIWKHWAALTALAMLLAGSGAHAQQDDPPARVARLSQQDAGVQWSTNGSDWQSADPNWPLTRGDSIRVAAGSRAELHAGAHALRLQGPAQLEIGALDDDEMRLTLVQGGLNLTVRDTVPGEDIEINTQNLALRIDRAGEFRIDADPAGDTTRVAARSGTGTLYGESGESATLAPAQQARYVGRNLTAMQLQGAGPRDALDQWAADRNRLEDQSQAARYVSRETIGYQELDANGEWGSHAEYGTVWYPRVTVADWAPYRYGQWRWVDPWGWTWIDDARWGFAPFHYGRWVQVGPRWAWAPGPRQGRPAYAPALVGFGTPAAHRPPGPGRGYGPSNEWFPLAPGEVWRPGFGSQRYLDRVNRGQSPTGPGQPPRYRFEQRPDAVTTLPQRGGMPPRDGVRSTVRERQPGIADPRLGLPTPGFSTPPSQERWQRTPQWQQQQQQQRQQQLQNQADNELRQRQEQMRQEQFQRESQARQQQRMLQDQQTQQTQQMRQQRQMQEQQQRQLQEPQRQHERFMRDQADAQRQQMDQQRQQMERQRRDTQPPRGMQQQDRQPGEPGVRSGARERP